MNLTEYEKVKDFTYLEYCDYLQNKYGIGLSDYMTKSWNKNRNVTRTKDGLLAHHKFEDHAIMLSHPEYARDNPYEWQLAKNIVYCDYLEHLLLHILICKYPAKNKNEGEIVGYGGVVNHLVPELNDLYSGWETNQAWRKNCHDLVRKDIEVYYKLLEMFMMLNIDDPAFCINELCKSFNEELGGAWSANRNEELYDDIIAIYVMLKDNY